MTNSIKNFKIPSSESDTGWGKCYSQYGNDGPIQRWERTITLHSPIEVKLIERILLNEKDHPGKSIVYRPGRWPDVITFISDVVVNQKPDPFLAILETKDEMNTKLITEESKGAA